MFLFKNVLPCAFAIMISSVSIYADMPIGYEDPEHGEAHTHIGRNWDKIWGTTDDDKLWIGSAQIIDGSPNLAWPSWSTIELLPQYNEFGSPIQNEHGKQFFMADEPDGWFAAHAEDGSWQFEGLDPQNPPLWNISIQRLGATEGFFMLRLSDEQIVLNENGDTENLHKEYEQWLENGSGGFGAWGCHHHLRFCAWADPGQNLSATFVAIDTGGQFSESDPFTINFTAVPEPLSCLFWAAGFAVLRKCRKDMI